MSGLDAWIRQATRQLSKDSAGRVRAEIQEHYEAAREAAVSSGATREGAERSALTALGDAKTANCQYRQVLLTSAEARVLREGNWEARAVCSRGWAKGLALTVTAAAVLGAGGLYVAGESAIARIVLVVGLGMSPLLAALFLPLYTPSRARVFRWVKWAAITGALVLAFGADTLKWSWLLISCLWPLAWTEWTRASIRRKLPVERWPKQLYL